MAKGNLVQGLDPIERKKLGDRIVKWYDTDLLSRADWEEKRKESARLWLSKPAAGRTPPWPDGANVGLPITASACQQFSARSLASITQAPDVVKVLATEFSDMGRADRVEKCLNWQVRAQIKEWEDELDKLLTALPIDGTAFFKTWWDKKEDRPRVEFVSASDVVLPYKTRNLESARRITHRYHRHIEELMQQEATGFFDGVEEFLLAQAEEVEEGEIVPNRQPAAKVQPQKMEQTLQEKEFDDALGLGEAPNGEEIPRLILECHFLDTKGAPMIAWVDYETRTVLRLTKRTVKGVVVNYFTDFHFITNPSGFYSFAYSHFTEPLNRIGETIFNLTIDSARISNQPFGFFGRRAGFKNRRIELFPGAMIEVEDATQVRFPSLPRLDQSLFMCLGQIDRYLEIFSSNSEPMTGRQQKGVREPTARGTMALIEQGMVSFGILTKRVYRSLAKQYQNLIVLNSLYMKEQTQFRILGSTEMAPFSKVFKDDFEGKYDIFPTSDPSYASAGQRRAEASEMMQVFLQHPMIGMPNQQTGEVANPVALAAVTKDWLETYDKKDLVPIVVPELPEPPMNPFQENAQMMAGIPRDPKPGEDHMQHVEAHKTFVASKSAINLDDEIVNRVVEHIHKHLALEEQEQAAQGANQEAVGPEGPDTSPGPDEEGPQEQVVEGFEEEPGEPKGPQYKAMGQKGPMTGPGPQRPLT